MKRFVVLLVALLSLTVGVSAGHARPSVPLKAPPVICGTCDGSGPPACTLANNGDYWWAPNGYIYQCQLVGQYPWWYRTWVLVYPS